MILEFTFSPEQLDAIAAAKEATNAALPDGSVPYTTETYLRSLVFELVNQRVEIQYNQAVGQLGAAAKNLPYAERLERMAQLKTQLS